MLSRYSSHFLLMTTTMLAWSATAEKTLPQPEDLLVHGLDAVQGYEAFGEFEGNMYAGTLPSDNGNRTGEMMFWLFEPETQEVPDSMIL